ncbi:MAG: PIG-L deacetylase family protein [Candidatus Kerfeldbacteria bacterium]|jgi:N-acetylglucosamine malate deacetylase 2
MKNFLGNKILILTAHPDDESYVAAGTIFKNYQGGGSTILVCASYGEKGTSHLKKKLSVNKFKKVRNQELLKAAKVLHIDPVHIIGVPDGQVESNKKKVFNYFLKYAEKCNPQIIISFNKDGISGHHDHIAVGEVAKKVANKIKIPFASFSLPPKVQKEAIKYLKTRRTAGHYANKVNYIKPNFRIKINRSIKKKAIQCHQSQLDGNKAFTGFPDFAVKELLKAEYFIINSK